MRVRYVCLVYLVVGACFNGEACMAQVSEADKALERIRGCRKGVNSLHVNLRSVYHDQGESGISTDTSWEIWEDQSSRRGDKTLGGTKRVNCFDCYPGGRHVFASTEPTEAGKPFALVINQSDSAAASITTHFVPDARWLGFLPADLLTSCYFSPNSVYARKGGTKASVSTDKFRDLQVTRVDWVDYYGIDTKAWISNTDPVALHALHRTYTSAEGIVYVEKIETQGRREGSYWVPLEYTYTRTENGQVSKTDNVQFSEFKINPQVPSKTFSVAGIDIVKPGMIVAWNAGSAGKPGDGVLYWNGSDVTTIESKVRSWRWTVLLVNTCIACCAIAIYFYFHSRRRSATNAI
jgi:hypothetical protein